MDWYLDALRNYAVFKGRASRRGYWLFFLCHVLITFTLVIADEVTGMLDADSGLGLLSGLYTFAVLIPGMAVAVRRLHDTNHSGWWMLISFIPIVGAVVLLVFLVRRGQPGPNRFGPVPAENITSQSDLNVHAL